MVFSTTRLQYSVADLSNFLRARTLAGKADAAIDQERFRQVIASHSSEGYDSYKYFDKQLWLRSKMMRAIELGLDKGSSRAVLDLGCGAGYFLYCCKHLGHDVHGIDLPTYEFYRDMIALFGIPRTGFRIEPRKNLPILDKRFDVITAHQICFNGHKTENLWGPEEWDYFLNDLQKNYLKPGGTIALEFNAEPEIGFYTKEVRGYFESRATRIFRGRVIIAGDIKPSPAFTPSETAASGLAAGGLATRT
ncbi:class I SAM-dependent methyltransferase [Bradyrhizobium sp. Tv2a-2]|uniref:class I SAM-dependent methyltransferase n=1 Tax=Bradyrhizobium sp. Tv2a-2 TaxID=113395 RepID=UPI00040CB9E0|nr:class I SAM-dependent methyltransferase [Bradyrhizobium sp. Tv2a-2]